jgi:hypothetical protein
LFKKYQSQIVLEVGGHDHWTDLRYIDDPTGAYRNLFIPISIGLDHGNLPGVSNFKIQEKTFTPYDLVVNSLDIRETYGMSQIPRLDQITTHVLEFKNFGILSLTAPALKKSLTTLDRKNIQGEVALIISKNGYGPEDPQGMKLVKSWSLLDKSGTNAQAFSCQQRAG